MINVGTLVGDAFGDNPARVGAVQAAAAACTDRVPFLLMPVRVESRFAQVEQPVVGPTVTAQLANALAAAATTAEALATRNYVTALPSGTPNRKAFKRTVEGPLVTTAAQQLQSISTQLAGAKTLLSTVTISSAADLAAVQAAVGRLRQALPAAQTAIGALRSSFHRAGLLATLATTTALATSVLAAAAQLPSDAIVTALQAASDSRVVVTASGTTPLVVAADGQSVGSARLATTAQAHNDLLARLDVAQQAVAALEAVTDPAARHLRLDAAAPTLAGDLAAAQAHAAALAVIPQDWHASLTDRVGALSAQLSSVLATAHSSTEAFGVLGQLGQLTQQVAAVPTDANGPLLVVSGTATQLANQLRVRIFPDDLAVLTHETALTETEQVAGIGYWQQAAAGAGDQTVRRAAWRALVEGFGSARSAWIVQAMAPAPVPAATDITAAVQALRVLHKRIDETGGTRVPALTKALDGALAAVSALPAVPAAAAERIRTDTVAALAKISAVTPVAAGWAVVTDRAAQLDAAADVAVTADPQTVPATAPATRDSAWTQQPTAGLLPQCFVVVTVQNGVVCHVVAGSAVRADLAVGLNPSADSADESLSVAADGSVQMPASLRWMIDYDAAEAAGMAVTLPISVAEAEAGFDRVYVIGVGGTDPAAGQQQLVELLENHHYNASGLALLPAGAATNSTAGRPSAYRSDDDADRSFPIELGAALAAADTDGARAAAALGVPASVFDHVEYADGTDIADAITANTALWPATAGYGLEELLGTVVGLDLRDRLQSFAQPNVLARGVLPTLRIGPQPYGLLVTHAYTRYVPDGGAAFPAADPATLTEGDRQWRFELLLRDTLHVMHADWTTARRAHVEHAYSTAGGQDQVLQVLGLDAGSAGYEQRFAINAGRRGLGIAGNQLAIGLPGLTATPAANAGAYALVQKFQTVFEEGFRIPPGPLLTSGLVSPPFAALYDQVEGTRSYEVRYLDQTIPLGGVVATTTTAAHVASMLARSLFDLVNDAAVAGQHDQPLGELLLRQALLVQARDAALRILVAEGAITESIRNRVGAGDLFRVSTLAGTHDVTRWSMLLGQLSTLSGQLGPAFPSGAETLFHYLTSAAPEQRMHQYLDHRGANSLFTGFAHSGNHQPFIEALNVHAGAVSTLAALDPDRVTQLTLEHLDLCSYRLDAWLLGFGAARLQTMRDKTGAGLHVGAFGWLDDLRPKPQLPVATGVPAMLNLDPNTPVVADPSNGGFVHAPSMNHASTAAILRAGYLAHHTGSDAENRMAVNLSSARVQRALTLIDGVGAGNDLGSLLGYQFERDLHDAYEVSGIALDDLIAPLRAAFPSVVDVSGSAGANADRHVVDGLRLLTAVRSWLDAKHAPEPTTLFPVLQSGGYTYYPYGLIASGGASLLPATTDPTRLDAVLHAIDRLADTLDAVGDLYAVEGVHQLVEGNQARAAAVLSALAEGRVPGVPEVVDTPVEGTRVTHRVLLHLPITTSLPDGWTVPSPRAAAEPVLNHWLGTVLGAPGLTRARVVAGDGSRSVDVNLTALGLQPIDLLAVLESGLDDGLTELAARFVDTRRPLDVRDDRPPPALQLVLERDPAWPADVRSLAETAALIEALGAVVRGGRAAEPVDYTLADTATSGGPGVDVGKLADRRTAALAALQAVGVRLIGLLHDGATADPAVLTGDVAAWIDGQSGTYRGVGVGAGVRLAGLDALWLRREDFHDALLAGLGFGISGAVPPVTFTSRDQVARGLLEAAESTLREVARRLIAAGAQSGMDALRTIFGSSLPVLTPFVPGNGAELEAALAAPPTAEPELAVSRWLAGSGPVRETLLALTMAATIATAFGSPWPVGVPAQLPVVDGEPWLAEAAPTGPGDRLSLVLLAPAALATDGSPVVAVLVDQFTELIPSSHATTGVTFNYDQPDAMPPQTMLLAVPPQMRGAWQLEDLVQTLDDTLELALNRAVEPAHLQDQVYGQLLPAVIGDIPPYGAGGGASDHRVVLDFGTVQPAAGS